MVAPSRLTVWAAIWPPAVNLNLPFGFAIHWQRVTFDTFFEIAPGLSLYPLDLFTFGATVGGRYYF